MRFILKARLILLLTKSLKQRKGMNCRTHYFFVPKHTGPTGNIIVYSHKILQ